MPPARRAAIGAGTRRGTRTGARCRRDPAAPERPLRVAEDARPGRAGATAEPARGRGMELRTAARGPAAAVPPPERLRRGVRPAHDRGTGCPGAGNARPSVAPD